ncbi:MAG: ABC transporter ATP-binding protein [Zoogloeaceae bacterium]|jgi:ABC-2 type transport system ATP-binding protein|nr:ABC transporter ATP-binding protein [Zoogloeaceae bacterium]
MSFSAPGDAPMIGVQRIIYDYPGHRALDEVSFELPAASVTALVGPNGAGKTTLLRSMAALEEPMYGRIVINGLDIWENPRLAHRFMGYLPDHFGLYKELSAWRCLLYAAWAHGMDADAATAAARWAAEQVGLLPQLEMLAGALSRGQRQRLALAQTIVHKPKVLLLDEPASGLDPEARANLARLMKSLAAEGMTLLISSHILAELDDYCTAMLVLEQGKLLARQQLSAPAERQTRTLRLRLTALPKNDDNVFSVWLATRGWRIVETDRQTAVLLLEGENDASAQTRLLRELLASGCEVLEYGEYTRNLQTAYLDSLQDHRNNPEQRPARN